MTEADEDTLETSDGLMFEELRARAASAVLRVVDWAGDSVVGSVREHNEDRWLAVDEVFFAVADGMGGREGGEIAAETVVDELAAVQRDQFAADPRPILEAINGAVLAAGREAEIDRLGSTLVGLVFHGSSATIVCVGDSRIYRLRHGQLVQLTHDHTVRSELLNSGADLGPFEERGVRLDALTSHMGVDDLERLSIERSSHAVAAGDRFLLCSDGVHGQLDVEMLAQLLGSSSCRGAVDALLSASDRAGGRDNATAIVVEIGPEVIDE